MVNENQDPLDLVGIWPALGQGQHSETTKTLFYWIKNLCKTVQSLKNKVVTLETAVTNLENENKNLTDKLTASQTITRPTLDWNKVFDKNAKSTSEDVMIIAKIAREIKTKVSKENNIIISGLNELEIGTDDEKNKHDENEVGKVLNVLGIAGSRVKRRVRIKRAQQESKPGLILVEFEDKVQQKQALRSARLLKEKTEFNKIYINKDLTRSELEEAKERRDIIRERNNILENGEGQLKYGIHNEKEFYWGERFGNIVRIDRHTKRAI
jgi:hypothetical protein